MKVKRERALNYWKDRVTQDFLPPIDQKKRVEGSIDRLSKLREEKSPNRLVSEIVSKKGGPAFIIKKQEEEEDGYDEEKVEKRNVDRLPDKPPSKKQAKKGPIKHSRNISSDHEN